MEDENAIKADLFLTTTAAEKQRNPSKRRKVRKKEEMNVFITRTVDGAEGFWRRRS